MDNASRALLMAAGVIVGVLILGIGIYLFKIFGNYGNDIAQKIEQVQIDTFNNQFTKYASSFTKGEGWYNLCTIHDVATIANLANKNNTELGFYTDEYNQIEAQKALRYITVTMKVGSKITNNLETSGTDKLNDLLQEYSTEYDDEGKVIIPQFSCDVHINDESKLVDSVTFSLVK